MKNLFKYLTFSLLTAVMIQACTTKPVFPPEPKIEFVSLSDNMVESGEVVEIWATLSFEDGDGNLGKNPDVESLTCNPALICDLTADSSCFLDPFFSAYLIDMRSECVAGFIELPDFEPNGKIKAVSGELRIVLPPIIICSNCNNCATDSVQYKIVVRDLDNNLSNEVFTDYVYINCN